MRKGIHYADDYGRIGVAMVRRVRMWLIGDDDTRSQVVELQLQDNGTYSIRLLSRTDGQRFDALVVHQGTVLPQELTVEEVLERG